MTTAKAEKKKPKVNLNEMVLCGKEKLFGLEKSRYLRGKFQQVVIQALQKKEEEERNDEDDTKNNLEIPKNIETSLNMSKMNLTEFPIGLLEKMEKVQYLYLEGNKLTELPKTFFQKLPSLQWLDLRNNCLTSLPNLGLRNHSSLEIILLQGNRIRNLPIELGTVPTLRGLQTTGNPLTNVPYDCVAEGFSGIMSHLKKLCSQNDILVPGSQTVLVKPSTSQDDSQNEENYIELNLDSSDIETKNWDLEKLSQWRHFMKRKSSNQNTDALTSTEEKRPLQKPKVTIRVRPKVPFKIVPFKCGSYNRNRHKVTTSAAHRLKMRKTRLGYKRNPVTTAIIEEKARREAYAAQLRETLEKQARKIQRMRDKEVLKAWRDHARLTRQQMKLLDNYQRYPSRDFANETPFDVDPEFLNMLNRADIYRSLKDYDLRSKKVKKPKVRITALDLERQMNEIISKLKNLDTNEIEEISSPRSKEVHMCNKMSKIMDIQKTLKRLQTLNSSMSGITPLGGIPNTGK